MTTSTSSSPTLNGTRAERGTANKNKSTRQAGSPGQRRKAQDCYRRARIDRIKRAFTKAWEARERHLQRQLTIEEVSRLQRAVFHQCGVPVLLQPAPSGSTRTEKPSDSQIDMLYHLFSSVRDALMSLTETKTLDRQIERHVADIQLYGATKVLGVTNYFAHELRRAFPRAKFYTSLCSPPPPDGSFVLHASSVGVIPTSQINDHIVLMGKRDLDAALANHRQFGRSHHYAPNNSPSEANAPATIEASLKQIEEALQKFAPRSTIPMH